MATNAFEKWEILECNIIRIFITCKSKQIPGTVFCHENGTTYLVEVILI